MLKASSQMFPLCSLDVHHSGGDLAKGKGRKSGDGEKWGGGRRSGEGEGLHSTNKSTGTSGYL